MKKPKSSTIIILLIIFIIFLYDHFLLNALEKQFCDLFFTDKREIKRPLPSCSPDLLRKHFFHCLGMPSGHAQSATIVSLLLYHYGFFSWFVAAIIVFVICIQRVVSRMHTPLQVLVGFVLGLIYACIYIVGNLSYKCFVIIFVIAVAMILAMVYKIDRELAKPVPEWVEPDMLPYIEKKKNVPFYTKIIYIIICILVRGILFLSWTDLERYMDILIEKIKREQIRFDAVVGIKTGGAILSGYLAKKLQLPEYKIKMSYNCDKKPIDTIIDTTYSYTLGREYKLFSVCEDVDGMIQGKNIILIDEQINSGNTITEIVNYLYEEKRANFILPMSISEKRKKFFHVSESNKKLFEEKKRVDNISIVNDYIGVWPWGYDN